VGISVASLVAQSPQRGKARKVWTGESAQFGREEGGKKKKRNQQIRLCNIGLGKRREGKTGERGVSVASTYLVGERRRKLYFSGEGEKGKKENAAS